MAKEVETRAAANAAPTQRGFTEPKARYPEPRLLKRADQVPLVIELPGLDDGANRRLWHRGLKSERAFARRVTIPPGGGTPIHGVTCDHIIVGLEGSVEFVMNGRVFELDPGDLLYFPANILYEIHNRGDVGAVLISVGIEAEFGWPARSSYWHEPVSGE